MDKANDAVPAMAGGKTPMVGEGPEDPGHTASPHGASGRGTHSNAAGRYERYTRALTDDGWGSLDEQPPHLRTVLIRDSSRTIITRNNSPDISFDRSINPYKGCEHGCVYCFARPTHAYLGLSPGLDFESKIYFKPHAAQLLERELRDPNYVPKPIAMGANTDPYQPVERTHKITRSVLKVLSAYQHPVTIVTKSHLIARDVDILGPMAERRLAKAALSITTLDRRLARKMEPRAATPERRLDAIELLARAGIPAAVMIAPVIPGLNDSEIEAILERAAEAGATSAGYIVLRMPFEIKDLFREWLNEHYPDRASKVIKLIKETRGGKDYDAQWGRRMVGQGAYSEQIGKRFRLAAKRFGLTRPSRDLDVRQFRLPPLPGDQMSLL